MKNPKERYASEMKVSDRWSYYGGPFDEIVWNEKRGMAERMIEAILSSKFEETIDLKMVFTQKYDKDEKVTILRLEAFVGKE